MFFAELLIQQKGPRLGESIRIEGRMNKSRGKEETKVRKQLSVRNKRI